MWMALQGWLQQGRAAESVQKRVRQRGTQGQPAAALAAVVTALLAAVHA